MRSPTTEEWSLIVAPEGGRPPELYHLASDLWQNHNVYGEYPQHAQRLQEALLQFLAQHGADQTRIRAYERAGQKQVDSKIPPPRRSTMRNPVESQAQSKLRLLRIGE